MKTAVVIGSTGLIGTALIKKLVQQASFGQILVILRKKPSDEPVFENPKIRVLSFDFKSWPDLELQVRSFIGGSPSVFFCCLGTTIRQAGSEEAFKKVDLDYPVDFAEIAHSCRAEMLLVVSALGADKESGVFYNRIKGQMEASVKAAFPRALHFLRPSLLLGDRKDFRFGERVAILLAPAYSPLLLGSLQKYRPISAAQVVKVLIGLANKSLKAGSVVENPELLKF